MRTCLLLNLSVMCVRDVADQTNQVHSINLFSHVLLFTILSSQTYKGISSFVIHDRVFSHYTRNRGSYTSDHFV